MTNRAHFRFSTDILRRLGEELNPSVADGILELVKNAYDADARTCEVRIVQDKEGHFELSVRDNGDGMDLDSIRDGWLVLGRSRKDRLARTRTGRVPAGSKGLGRLAALRLGEEAVLRSRPRGSSSESYQVVLDWLAFEEVAVVEDVPLEITTLKSGGLDEHGTEIRILRLRKAVTRAEIKKLARALILLADPFEDDSEGFHPVLDAPEYADLAELVRRRYFEQADYQLEAHVDGAGEAVARVLDWRGEVLFETGHEDLSRARPGKRTYACPQATFQLWNFILSSASFRDKPVGIAEVRNWLTHVGGVHVYQNGLRVGPYGDPGNDWLGMNVKRAASPEERPSTNNSIGRMALDDPSWILEQKTDRGGFIHGETFEDMRAFARDAIDWMARRRLEVAETRRAKGRTDKSVGSKKSRDRLKRAIETGGMPKRSQSEIEEALLSFDRSVEREVQVLRKEVQLYRTLSTAGITAATFSHESAGNPIKVIASLATTIGRRGRKALGEEYSRLLEKPVTGILNAVRSLSVLGEATLNLLESSKRRVGRVDVHAVTERVIETFTPFLDGRKVTVDLQLFDAAPYLRGSEAALESILTNLLNNSLAAFEKSSSPDRQLRIRTLVEDQWVSLEVSDNGPGIEGISVRDVWLPGQTTKIGGTGLGLTIVRDTVSDLGGEVDVAAAGELGGAVFTIRLPIIGS